MATVIYSGSSKTYTKLGEREYILNPNAMDSLEAVTKIKKLLQFNSII